MTRKSSTDQTKPTVGQAGDVSPYRPDLFDDRGRTLPWIARTLHRAYDAHAKQILDRENLAIAYWYYLRVLAERGELNQLELSRRVGIASTTAVPALDYLEKRDLVERRRDPADRRRYYIRLKKEGQRLVDEMFPEVMKMIAASVEGVSPKDMQVFWKVLHAIEDNLGRMSQDDEIMD